MTLRWEVVHTRNGAHMYPSPGEEEGIAPRWILEYTTPLVEEQGPCHSTTTTPTPTKTSIPPTIRRTPMREHSPVLLLPSNSSNYPSICRPPLPWKWMSTTTNPLLLLLLTTTLLVVLVQVLPARPYLSTITTILVEEVVVVR